MEYFREVLSFLPHLPIRIFYFSTKDKKYIYPLHQHRDAEIIYCLKGQFYVEMPETRYILKTGDILFLNPEEPHGTHGDPENEIVCLHMSADFFSEMTGRIDFKINRDLLLQDERKNEIGLLLKQIYARLQIKEEGNRLKICSLLFELAYLLVSRYQKISPRLEISSQRKRDTLNIICAYIRAHQKERISLESVASYFSYTPQYLSSLFKTYLQTTFLSYLNALRADASIRLLLDTDESIQQIAAASGFASSKAYNRTFRNLYGILPSEYRKMNNRPESH